MRIRLGSKNLCRNASRATGFLDRLAGLQGRSRWPHGTDGILFPDCSCVHTFFTFLRPDILFLDASGKILGVHGETPAWKVLSGPRRTSDTLELPSGVSRRLAIRTGQTIRFHSGNNPRRR